MFKCLFVQKNTCMRIITNNISEIISDSMSKPQESTILFVAIVQYLVWLVTPSLNCIKSAAGGI